MTPKIAVILFPGTNCELEALRACERSHMKADIFRWNDDRKKLRKYDGFILPGGFSYEDRGRSGIIASKDPIVEVIMQESQKGKPVMGICNGAQILVEAGFIPGLDAKHLEMALTWNERIKNGKILGVGFYNEWVYIKSDATKGRSIYNRFEQDVLMHIPVAHGEGRFTTQEKNLLENLIKNEQTLFRYCNAKGEIKDEFPVNPNGALYNLAGVCNPEGNVLALMPHPERTIKGQAIFDSVADYLTSSRKKLIRKKQKINIRPIKEMVEKPKKKADLIILVELIITDNEERTIENAIKDMGYKNVRLKRKIYFGFDIKPGFDPVAVAEKIIRTGEIINLNKEIPTILAGNKVYGYDKQSGLFEKKKKTTGPSYYVADYDNYAGKNVKAKLEPYFALKEIKKVEKGVHWEIAVKREDTLEKVIRTHIFHNPHAMRLVQLSP